MCFTLSVRHVANGLHESSRCHLYGRLDGSKSLVAHTDHESRADGRDTASGIYRGSLCSD